MTVYELLGRMTSEELTLQMAYDKILGEEHQQRELEARAQANLNVTKRL